MNTRLSHFHARANTLTPFESLKFRIHLFFSLKNFKFQKLFCLKSRDFNEVLSCIYFQTAASALDGTDATTNGSTPSTEEALDMQRKKCENLIAYFTTQIRGLNDELEHERGWRVNQLAKIVKALLCFEAKLKNEQKQIRHQLFEKDAEINRLSREIIGLKEKYGEKDDAKIDINEVAQFCPNCRKQYYQLDRRTIGVQVHRNPLGCTGPGDNGM